MRFRSLATLSLLTLSLPTSTSAETRRQPRANYDGGYVTTYSRYGNGEISGAVRPGRYAWEVQLPGGTGVSCRRRCEETLRVQSIDFFENQDSLTGYGTLKNQVRRFRLPGAPPLGKSALLKL